MTYRFDSENHIHLFDEQPLFGTSTVIKEVLPPFLAKWGAQCAVDYIREHGPDADLDKAVFAYTKVRDKAATKGTDMHAELESYVKMCISELGGEPVAVVADDVHAAVKQFSSWASRHVKGFMLSETNVYSTGTWTGGIIDCVAQLKDDAIAIIDFKSSKEAYFSQFLQTAGYALQFEENGAFTADGVRVSDPGMTIESLIVFPFGALHPYPDTITNVPGFKDRFRDVVEIYKFQKDFRERDKSAAFT